ncbi:sigma-70 family RNA polymerase sigma factor [Adhaeribacter swui]|uniref:Sigma-70 family RNA polymerase sigma factor n=1 Tax=Adhaeribacter swui TaxID=2086471 RepID=A0A7G7GAF7_9BACT|nr:sigma-70 family RNA polymerase sigma factor [Adhaeribacter swui]QNF34141.1 sigma-70 family RNA polymerase sigma factor [Adhaeribacter swui]
MPDNKVTTCPETEEVIWWNNLRKGSEVAYAAIYENYVSVLYTYGCRINPDEEVVKDCLQDLFLTLWKNHATLGATDSIKFYLFRALRREIARKAPKLKILKNDEAATAESSFEDRLITDEESLHHTKALEIALKQLSERQREAIYLKYYQNMSFEEIALMMDISARAVYKLIYRAIDVLQKSYPQTKVQYSGHPEMQLTYLALMLHFSDLL